LPDHEGARRTDVDRIKVLQLFGERRRSEGPVTTDIDSSQKNHQCHEFSPLPGPLGPRGRPKVDPPASCLPNAALQPRAIMRQWPAGCKRLLGGESERRIWSMTKAAQAVLADALRLDLDARAELAAELLASLDGPADPDAEAAWAAEIARRVDAIEAGAVKLESWTDVKRRIEREILGR